MTRAPHLVAVVLVVLAAAVGGEEPARESRAPAHLVIRERKIELLEHRLRAAANRGYRLLGAAESRGGSFKASAIQLHLERGAEGETVDYRVIAGPYSTRLERRVNDAAARGFRVRPDGILKRRAPSPLGRGDEETAVLLLERDGRGPPNEYRLLSLGTGKQFRRQLNRHHRDGFRFVGMRGFFGGWSLVIVERPITEQERVAPPEQGEPHFLLADRLSRRALNEQIAAAVARGYRIVAAETGGLVGEGSVVLLEKTVPPQRRFAYLSLNETPEELLEQRLNEGGHQGYRFRRGLGPRFVLLMERAAGSRVTASYRTISSTDAARLAATLEEGRADGYAFVGMYGTSLVLERAGPPPTPAEPSRAGGRD